MLKSNCHTHTKYCDGNNTAEEMVQKAIELGFVSLGFSGHCPMNFENDWGMTDEKLRLYYKEINALKEKYKDRIDILCGIEFDSDMDIKDEYSFDYKIASVHQIHKDGKFYSVDYSAEVLDRAVNEFYGGNRNEMAKDYFFSLADFVLATDADVVGHFDLITKFNEKAKQFDENDEMYQKYAIEAIDRITDKRKDILFEVNTGAMFRCGNSKPYPAEFILKHIKKKGGKITVTSDAHNVSALNFAFEDAVNFCRNCGFDEVYYLTSEGVKSVNI